MEVFATWMFFFEVSARDFRVLFEHDGHQSMEAADFHQLVIINIHWGFFGTQKDGSSDSVDHKQQLTVFDVAYVGVSRRKPFTAVSNPFVIRFARHTFSIFYSTLRKQFFTTSTAVEQFSSSQLAGAMQEQFSSSRLFSSSVEIATTVTGNVDEHELNVAEHNLIKD